MVHGIANTMVCYAQEKQGINNTKASIHPTKRSLRVSWNHTLNHTEKWQGHKISVLIRKLVQR